MPFTVEDAINVASRAHKGQKRWNGDPYITHPLRVMLRMPSDSLRIIAVLHDTLEDTELTREELISLGCGEVEVATITDLSRKERESYQDFIQRVSNNPIATTIKIPDLEDNLNLGDLIAPTQEKDLKRIGKYLDALALLRKVPHVAV